MIEIVVLALVWFFIVVPLYKAIRKTTASKTFNQDLFMLANQYENYMLRGDITNAQKCLEQARVKVRAFFSDIRMTPQELVQAAPAVTRFPNWEVWL